MVLEPVAQVEIPVSIGIRTELFVQEVQQEGHGAAGLMGTADRNVDSGQVLVEGDSDVPGVEKILESVPEFVDELVDPVGRLLEMGMRAFVRANADDHDLGHVLLLSGAEREGDNVFYTTLLR